MKTQRTIGLWAVCVTVSCGTAFGQQCLHDDNEQPMQQERRVLALNSVRVLNTAQSRHVAQIGRYAAFPELATSQSLLQFRDSATRFGVAFRQMSLVPGTDVVPGFSLRMLTDGSSYLLSVRDQTDPCGFAYSSDEGGIIRQARSLQ